LAGAGKANPAAAFFAAAMMLEYLGEREQAARLQNAVEACIAEGQATPDLGGGLTTNEMTKAVIGKW
jgi:isocitrate/isopropylmalate dehydrogenase